MDKIIVDNLNVADIDNLISDLDRVQMVNKRIHDLSKMLPRGWSVVIANKLSENGHDLKYGDFINTIKNPKKTDSCGVREMVIEYAIEVKKKNDELREKMNLIG
jgi:hypothetical protein